MDPKILTEEGWKKIVAQCKIKDNGLQRALGNYDKLDEEDHDGCLKGIAAVSQLAGALKKAKEVAAAPNALKYLTDLINAATAEARDVAQAKSKAKALAEKADIMEAKADAAKAKADAMEARAAAKAAEEEAEKEDEDEEEGGDFLEKLKKTLKNLKTAKDDFHFVICHDKPYGLVVSKTPISATHKKQLQEVAGGSKKYLPPGRCRMEGGTKLIFEMEKPPAPGFARILQKWIKNSTGLAFKVSVGGQSDEDEEEPALTGVNPELETPKAPTPGESPEGGKTPAAGKDEPALTGVRPFEVSATVGRGGKNLPEDVEAVQGQLNRRLKAGLDVNGKCDAKTIKAIEDFQKGLGKFKPDGLIEPGRSTARALAASGPLPPPPPPPKPIAPPKLEKPTLEKAPVVWRGTRGILETNIKELKKAIKQEYSDEHPDLLAEIDKRMERLDVVLEKLDHRLADTLANAHAAQDAAVRKTEMANAKAILADYIKYVKSEPMIDHMDSNPFGVKTNLKKVLTDSLTHVAHVIR